MITVDRLLDLPQAALVQRGAQNFTAAAFDSRKLRSGELFVALAGARDGHDFIPQAIAAGATGLLVSRDLIAPEGVTVVRVPDTLAALQRLGSDARQRYHGQVVAITGSVGKTTTKAMTAAVLAARNGVYASEASFNNHIGVPLGLLAIEEHHAYAVSEIGTNHPGEIDALTALVDPDVSVVTTVGYAHIGNFRSRDDLAAEKTDILRRVRHGGQWIVNADDPLISAQIDAIDRPDVTRTTIGFTETADLYATDVTVSEHGTTGRIRVDGADLPFSLPVAGRHFVTTALIALAVGRYADVPLETAIEALRTMPAPPGRAQIRRLSPTLLVIDDTYNASPDATLAALDLLAELPGETKIAALGEMRELGDHSDDLHRTVGRRAAEVADHLFTVGERLHPLLDGAAGGGLDIDNAARASGKDVSDAIAHALVGEDIPTVVLAKGARFMHMERVPLRLDGHDVRCALGVCTLYINCAHCPKLTTG